MKITKATGMFLESSFNRLSLISGYISGWVIFAMMILVTAAVFARRVVGEPLIFGDEYSAYMMVFCVFLGGAYTLQQEAHIRVDVVAIRLKPRLRIFLRAVTSLFSLIYGSVLTWETAKFVIYYKQIGHQALSVLETPTWIPAITIPIGLMILTLQMVVSLVEDVRLMLHEKSGAG